MIGYTYKCKIFGPNASLFFYTLAEGYESKTQYPHRISLLKRSIQAIFSRGCSLRQPRTVVWGLHANIRWILRQWEWIADIAVKR